MMLLFWSLLQSRCCFRCYSNYYCLLMLWILLSSCCGLGTSAAALKLVEYMSLPPCPVFDIIVRVKWQSLCDGDGKSFKDRAWDTVFTQVESPPQNLKSLFDNYGTRAFVRSAGCESLDSATASHWGASSVATVATEDPAVGGGAAGASREARPRDSVGSARDEESQCREHDVDSIPIWEHNPPLNVAGMQQKLDEKKPKLLLFFDDCHWLSDHDTLATEEAAVAGRAAGATLFTEEGAEGGGTQEAIRPTLKEEFEEFIGCILRGDLCRYLFVCVHQCRSTDGTYILYLSPVINLLCRPKYAAHFISGCEDQCCAVEYCHSCNATLRVGWGGPSEFKRKHRWFTTAAAQR